MNESQAALRIAGQCGQLERIGQPELRAKPAKLEQELDRSQVGHWVGPISKLRCDSGGRSPAKPLCFHLPHNPPERKLRTITRNNSRQTIFLKGSPSLS